GERLLDRLLGQIDVTEMAGQDGHRAAVLLAEDTIDLRGGQLRHGRCQRLAPSRTGRTSIGSVVACASLRPHSSATSRSGASMTVNPPMCSLPSAKGPSVISGWPSLTRTTVDAS